MNLMLLCAGEGTRLRPHTRQLPKPAIPFLGVPMAAYSLEWAREISPDRLVVNTYHLGPKVHELFHSLGHGFKQVEFSDEASLMGSGGGVSLARKYLRGGGDFLVMNGDEVTFPIRPGFLAEARRKHEAEKRMATLIVMDYPGVGTKFGGVWVDANNRVLGFGKTPIAGAVKAWHYIGPTFLSEGVLDLLPENEPSNLLYDGLVAAIARGDQVSVEVVEGWWHETGNEADLLTATLEGLPYLTKPNVQGDFVRGVLDRHAAGWKLYTRGSEMLLHLPGAHLDVDAKFTGVCVIGREARIEPGAVVENSVVGSGVIVPTGDSLLNNIRL